MSSDLPEDLPLHQSGQSGPGPLGLQRDRSPRGSCSSLLSCAVEIKKPCRAQLCSRSVLLLPGASGTAGKASRLPPARGIAALASPVLWGPHPSFWEGDPRLQRSCFKGLFPHPVWLGAALRCRGRVQGGLGDAAASKSHLTCVLCGPGCHMNLVANVGL